MQVTLNFRTDQTTRQLAKLRERAPFAIVRALNRTAASARTALSREIASDLKIKVGTVRERITIVDATKDKHTATFYASAKRIPAYDFRIGAGGPFPSRGRGRGVATRLPGGRYPRAFIARMGSGHMGVFERVGRARLPIRELFGPSIAHVFEKHVAVGIARFDEQLQKNLEHEFRFALQGAV